MRSSKFCLILILASCLWAGGAIGAESTATIERFAVFEQGFEAQSAAGHLYRELQAHAEFQRPDGATWRIPLFWDGGSTFRVRISPDLPGPWRYRVQSSDPGLNGKAGNFTCLPSLHPGSVRARRDFPRHFERQDGSPFWFLGDTAWAFFTDSAAENHNRTTATSYLSARASQGFNVIHSMLLSEAGWGNQGGPPFEDLATEQLNPGYWQEVDLRVRLANEHGFVCGLALAWGDKQKREPYAWRRFPSVEARRRYARYIAARYSAFNIYFLVSGEWHAEIGTRPAPEAELLREFLALGDELRGADPHGRMIGIHPMSSEGSVREFNQARWMSFGDYQQNYDDLHARLLQSRVYPKPVVNAEYGYFLRDQNGDGTPDKENSTTLEIMRHATWDILMAGGYVVTGFGTTYFGGNRDPGPFDVTAAKNRPWEAQIAHVREIFNAVKYWKLEPHDELLRCATPRGKDRRHLGRVAPPETAYWCLAGPGRQYLVYARGLSEPITLDLPEPANRFQVWQWNPRTGESRALETGTDAKSYGYQAPDREDWILILHRTEG